MKNLFALLFVFLMLGFATSCGDDEPETTCTVCTLAVPLFDDCQIDVCEDGTDTTQAGGTACLGGETALTGLTTQAEKVDALVAAGFTCN